MVRRHTGAIAALALAGLTAFGVAAAHEETTTVRWGPIDLPAATEEGPGELWNEIAGLSGLRAAVIDGITGSGDFEVNKPCEDCYIVGIKPNLVLENGETANFNNGVMLHHVVNLNFSNPDVTCRPSIFSPQPIKLLGALAGGNERIFAAGNERTAGQLTDDYGYYLAEGDHLGLIYHLMNMNPEPKTVYFEYTFIYQDAADHDLDSVRPIWMDVDQCGTSTVSVPAGYSDVTWDWQSDRTHRLVGAGGHIHNYGINVAWTNTSTSETLCNSLAGYEKGSPYKPVGPGTGDSDAHPEYPETVDSHRLGLENYEGNIATMSICTPGRDAPKTARRDEMRLNAQIYRPDQGYHDMGIMVGFMDEKFCLTDFWCF